MIVFTVLIYTSMPIVNNCLKEVYISALAGVTQWIECQPANQRVTGLIPSQGTHVGFRPGPQLGACEKELDVFLSLSFSLPSPLSKNK